MSSKSETTLAKNVANFQTLITFCLAYGIKYNPTKNILLITVLQALLQDAKQILKALNKVSGPYTDAVSQRQIAFKPLNALITRVKNALNSSEIHKSVLEDAESIIRKIQGRRATPKKGEEQAEDPNAEKPESKNNSASQLSFDSRLQNFDKLIQMLQGQPKYIPNEKELQTPALVTLYKNLDALNTLVIDTSVPFSNVRLNRDQIFYTEDTGLVDTALSVKSYVKSVFGSTSPQFKQISGLKFRKE